MAIDIDRVKIAFANHNAKIYNLAKKNGVYITGGYFKIKADIIFIFPS